MKRAIGLVLGIVFFLAFAFIFFGGTSPVENHPFFDNLDNGVLVISHQGGDFLWPSNTLYAFENSVELGVDILEFDIHGSKDGELVVIHDDTVDRTTDGSGLVKEQTVSELKALNAGHNWSPERKGERFPYRDLNLEIPLLTEVFDAFPNEHMSIEIKQLEPSITQSLCDLIREYKLETQVLVGSFHPEALQDFRERCPEVATSTTSTEVRNAFILRTLFLDKFFPATAQAFQVPESQGRLRIITPKFIKLAKNKNMNLQAWTINETADMQRLVEMGIDGIITDRPDRLKKVLGQDIRLELPEGIPE